MSYNTANYQAQLSAKRPAKSNEMPHVSSINLLDDFGDIYKPGEQDRISTRSFQVTPLESFDYSHLKTDHEKDKLSHAIQSAIKWQSLARSQRGLSFVIAGNVGTGKTTIAQNLMREFRQSVGVGTDDDAEYIALLRQAMNQPNVTPSQRDSLLKMINESSSANTTVSSARFLDSSELMAIMGDVIKGKCNLSSVINRRHVDLVVIDDVGDEEISFTSEKYDESSLSTIRAKRYSRFMDYCYGTNPRDHKYPIGVIVTSMSPMVERGGDGKPRISQGFKDIFGGKGFSRLYQMAKGYFVDLHGLPDYRQYIIHE